MKSCNVLELKFLLSKLSIFIQTLTSKFGIFKNESGNIKNRHPKFLSNAISWFLQLAAAIGIASITMSFSILKNRVSCTQPKARDDTRHNWLHEAKIYFVTQSEPVPFHWLRVFLPVIYTAQYCIHFTVHFQRMQHYATLGNW